MKAAWVAMALALPVGAGTLAGCASDPTQGYSFGSSFDERVQSIAVTVFRNDSFHPGIESDLTGAIVRRVQRDTPWRVVNPESAQTVLSGTITDVEINRLTQDTAGGISQQVGVRVFVDFQWRNNVTGRVLAERRGLSVTESFIPAAGEPLELGFSAATDEMAGAILETMRSVW